MAATNLQAIIARFDTGAAGALASQSGKLWFGEVPEDRTTFPLCCLAHGGAQPPDYNFENDYLEDDLYSFFVFHTDLAACEAMALEIKKLFDLPDSFECAAALLIDNASARSCVRTSYVVSVDEHDTPQGLSVYKAQLDYTLTVRKTRGTS